MRKSNYTTPTEQKQQIPPTKGGFFAYPEMPKTGTLGNTVNYERTLNAHGEPLVQSLQPPLQSAIESALNAHADTLELTAEQVNNALKEIHARRMRYDIQNRVSHLLAPYTKNKYKKDPKNGGMKPVIENGRIKQVTRFDVCTCGRIHKNRVYKEEKVRELKDAREKANELLQKHSHVSLDFDIKSGFSGSMLMYNTNTHTAVQRDMHKCGKVWQCPVCTSAISKARQLVIEKAVNSPKWCTLMMMTFTTPHHAWEDLATVQKGQSERYENMMRNKAFTDKLKNLGYLAKVTTKEVTVTTANGWHPHYHVLVFLEDCLSIEEQKSFADHVKNEWIRVCKGIDKRGRPFKNPYKYRLGIPSYDHGADVRFVVRKKGLSKEELAKTYEDIRKLIEYYKKAMANGTNSEDYYAQANYTSGTFKADPTYEMTHWHKKNPFRDTINFNSVRGFSPFQLAVIATTEEVPEDKREWAKKRFLEYVDNYFGVQQTIFSRKFAEAMGISNEDAEAIDASDEELANKTEKQSVELFYVEEGLLKFIQRQRFGLPRLYEMAERSVIFGDDSVKSFVANAMFDYVDSINKSGGDADADAGLLAYMAYFEKTVMERDLREYVEEQDRVIKKVLEQPDDKIDWSDRMAMERVLLRIEEQNGGGAYEIVEFKPKIIDTKRKLLLKRDMLIYIFKDRNIDKYCKKFTHLPLQIFNYQPVYTGAIPQIPHDVTMGAGVLSPKYKIPMHLMTGFPPLRL